MLINAKEMDYKTLNEKLRFADEDVTIENCCGQRFIASAMSGHAVTIEGVPGNALGAYLNGGEITVYGNAQDAVGDIFRPRNPKKNNRNLRFIHNHPINGNSYQR